MTYTFNFDEKEAQLVLEALVEMPFRKVAELISNIQKQAQEQTSRGVPPTGGGGV